MTKQARTNLSDADLELVCGGRGPSIGAPPVGGSAGNVEPVFPGDDNDQRQPDTL